jgi:hypothetical protein
MSGTADYRTEHSYSTHNSRGQCSQNISSWSLQPFSS